MWAGLLFASSILARSLSGPAPAPHKPSYNSDLLLSLGNCAHAEPAPLQGFRSEPPACLAVCTWGSLGVIKIGLWCLQREIPVLRKRSRPENLDEAVVILYSTWLSVKWLCFHPPSEVTETVSCESTLHSFPIPFINSACSLSWFTVLLRSHGWRVQDRLSGDPRSGRL